MEVQWKSVKDNPPNFGQRVLVYDSSNANNELSLRCATYVSKKESKRGIDYEWQVGNEQPTTIKDSIEYWTELPDNEPIF